MSAIDYGAVIFKNGERYKADEMFPTIDEIDVTFYKCALYVHDGKENSVEKFFTPYYKRGKYDFVIEDTHYVVKGIAANVYKCVCWNSNDRYVIIFGYGIDCSRQEWNRVKKIYHKNDYRKIDREFFKYGY